MGAPQRISRPVTPLSNPGSASARTLPPVTAVNFYASVEREAGGEGLRGRAPDAGMRLRLGIARWPMRGGERLWGWVGPLVITGLAFWIRCTGVTHPFWTKDKTGTLIGYFDETYYARDAHSLLLHGVELDGVASGSFVVHPPLGKWMIALGEQLWGFNELGSRMPSVIVGSLSILVFARFVRRITRSNLLGMIGGLLLSLDALEFVQSRIATLDIFLMFWILCCAACMAADRDQGRARLLERMTNGTHGVDSRPWAGPRLGFRWWRIGAGVCIGAACSVKWSAAPYLIVFALLMYAWDVGARRSAGALKPGRGAFRRDSLPLLGAMVVLPIMVYTASWTGWFATGDGYDRHDFGRGGVVGTLENWVDYHKAALCYHEGLTNTPTKKDHLLCGVDESQCRTATQYDRPLNTYCYSNQSYHPYESKPFGWLVLARPVAYAYDSVKQGTSIQGQKCTAKDQDCSRAILAVNTPILWWGALLCVVGCVFLWAARRDWRAAFVLAGVAAGFFPWLQNTQRVMFQFYSLPMLPFVVLAAVLVIGKALGTASSSPNRRMAGAIGVGVFVLAVFANFVWLHPVLSAQVIPYSAWHARVVSYLGFPNWI